MSLPRLAAALQQIVTLWLGVSVLHLKWVCVGLAVTLQRLGATLKKTKLDFGLVFVYCIVRVFVCVSVGSAVSLPMLGTTLQQIVQLLVGVCVVHCKCVCACLAVS